MKRRKCPTPHKIAYTSRDAAQRHVGALYAKDGKVAMVHPYKCKCGAWHVGGRRKKFGRRK
jgi:hypothetical protein